MLQPVIQAAIPVAKAIAAGFVISGIVGGFFVGIQLGALVTSQASARIRHYATYQPAA